MEECYLGKNSSSEYASWMCFVFRGLIEVVEVEMWVLGMEWYRRVCLLYVDEIETFCWVELS